MQFKRDPKKNLLIKQRPGGKGIGFEEAIKAIQEGDVLTILQNTPPYEHQLIYVLHISGYIYNLACIYKDNTLFLITLYPSRKSKKLYS